MKRRTKQWNERGSTRIAFRGSLLLKIEETGGRRKASYKRQVKTRDVPAIYLCRRGPPARNLRHFLFFSSSPFPPSPLSLLLLLFVSLSANILLPLLLLTSVLSSPVLFFPYLERSLSLSLSIRVGSSPFTDLRVEQTLQMDTLFLSGATCRTWFPPFVHERSRVSVSRASKETR